MIIDTSSLFIIGWILQITISDFFIFWCDLNETKKNKMHLELTLLLDTHKICTDICYSVHSEIHWYWHKHIFIQQLWKCIYIRQSRFYSYEKKINYSVVTGLYARDTEESWDIPLIRKCWNHLEPPIFDLLSAVTGEYKKA